MTLSGSWICQKKQLASERELSTVDASSSLSMGDGGSGELWIGTTVLLASPSPWTMATRCSRISGQTNNNHVYRKFRLKLG